MGAEVFNGGKEMKSLTVEEIDLLLSEYNVYTILPEVRYGMDKRKKLAQAIHAIIPRKLDKNKVLAILNNEHLHIVNRKLSDAICEVFEKGELWE